jgi:hypothetical protein
MSSAEGKEREPKDVVAKIISSNSAQKSHVKPQNHLNLTRSTTSTWHVYPHQSGTIKLDSKTTEDVPSRFEIKTLPARLLKTNTLPLKSGQKSLGWKTLRDNGEVGSRVTKEHGRLIHSTRETPHPQRNVENLVRGYSSGGAMDRFAHAPLMPGDIEGYGVAA